MRLSHAAARKYALIMSICLLAATDPNHGKLTKMLSDVITSTTEYGPVLVIACRWRDSSTYTQGQKRWLCRPFFHSVCLANGQVVGYVPRELSCKCSLSSVALRMPGASAQSVIVSR